jgi:hypothetical protein
VKNVWTFDTLFGPQQWTDKSHFWFLGVRIHYLPLSCATPANPAVAGVVHRRPGESPKEPAGVPPYIHRKHRPFHPSFGDVEQAVAGPLVADFAHGSAASSTTHPTERLRASRQRGVARPRVES